jgi:hypothetical protein
MPLAVEFVTIFLENPCFPGFFQARQPGFDL